MDVREKKGLIPCIQNRSKARFLGSESKKIKILRKIFLKFFSTLPMLLPCTYIIIITHTEIFYKLILVCNYDVTFFENL